MRFTCQNYFSSRYLRSTLLHLEVGGHLQPFISVINIPVVEVLAGVREHRKTALHCSHTFRFFSSWRWNTRRDPSRWVIYLFQVYLSLRPTSSIMNLQSFFLKTVKSGSLCWSLPWHAVYPAGKHISFYSLAHSNRYIWEQLSKWYFTGTSGLFWWDQAGKLHELQPLEGVGTGGPLHFCTQPMTRWCRLLRQQ